MPKAPKREIIPGEQFGSWTVVKENGRMHFPSGQSQRLVLVKCECGEIQDRAFNNIMNGKSKSCGCQREIYLIGNTRALRHGSSYTTTYKSWISMNRRCRETTDEKHTRDYFLRGIRVCNRWINSFQNFLDDMGPRPEGMTIDRIDNDGDYEPLNCQWATPLQQNRNRRCSRTKFQKSIDVWRKSQPKLISQGLATMLLASMALESLAKKDQ